MEPVLIQTLLDTDMYKLTMMQAMFHKYTSANTRWAFKCRDGSGFPDGASKAAFLDALNKSIDHLCTLRFTPDELEWVRNIRTKAGNQLFKDDFVDYLEMFKFNRKHVNVFVDVDGSLGIELDGPWVAVSPFEVPVLAIVSELTGGPLTCEDNEEARMRLIANLAMISLGDRKKEMIEKGFKFADFGTRRRRSADHHEGVIDLIMVTCPELLAGTSNLDLARRWGLTPIGTMAHEWFQAHQQLGARLVDSQKDALEVWTQEYRGELGIALSDICGFDAFLRDFDLMFAKLFDGCRHDSGDAVEWCEKLIAHYEAFGIDPKTKTAVFSDGLTFGKMMELFEMFHARINVSFGIGTKLTNDTGKKAPNIVLKMVELNGLPVAKISDSPGKGMCEDPEFEKYLKRVFKIEV